MSEHQSLLLRPTGALDVDSCDELRQQLATAFSVGVLSIAVDLSAVTAVDVVGLGVLAGAAKHLRKRGGVLVVSHASPQVSSLMRINGMGELLEVPASPPLRVVAGAGETTSRPRSRSLSVVHTRTGA